MAVLIVVGIVGAVVWFFLVYTAVRLGVTDAIRGTVRPDLLLPPEPASEFQLDAGDDDEPRR